MLFELPEELIDVIDFTKLGWPPKGNATLDEQKDIEGFHKRLAKAEKERLVFEDIKDDHN